MPSVSLKETTAYRSWAVVLALTHFCHYLYGNKATVFTDHMAVKAILETPNLTGKHARWRKKVYGQGIREVKITYHSGRENTNADTLSRSAYSFAPAVGIAEKVHEVGCEEQVPARQHPSGIMIQNKTLLQSRGRIPSCRRL